MTQCGFFTANSGVNNLQHAGYDNWQCTLNGPLATPSPAPTPTATFDPCCPPWNSTVLKNSMVYQGTGGISDPYTLKFAPSVALNAQMVAYVNYVKTLFPTVTSMSVSFQLFGDGNGASYSVGTPVTGGGPFLATWTTGPPITSFFA